MTLKRYAFEPYMTLTRYPWRYCSDFYPLHLAVILIELWFGILWGFSWEFRGSFVLNTGMPLFIF